MLVTSLVEYLNFLNCRHKTAKTAQDSCRSAVGAVDYAFVQNEFVLSNKNSLILTWKLNFLTSFTCGLTPSTLNFINVHATASIPLFTMRPFMFEVVGSLQHFSKVALYHSFQLVERLVEQIIQPIKSAVLFLIWVHSTALWTKLVQIVAI